MNSKKSTQFMVLEEQVMTMKDWIKATDDLLKLSKKKILPDSGKV